MSQTTTKYDAELTQGTRRLNTLTKAKWIDITVPIYNGLVHWPGDPEVSIERIHDMREGDTNNVSKIAMGSHTGTHADAPRHFFKHGPKIDAMPLDQMIGIARVIEIHHAKYVTPEELKKHNIKRGERILFKTRNSSYAWYENNFDENFVSISSEAADFLARIALKVVGIDYLSVGGFADDGAYIHRRLLGSGIWLLEGLDLSKVKQGKYYLNCLPLKLEPGDGAPVHAILRPI